MNFDDNIRRIGSASIDPVKELLATYGDEEWDRESIRQKRYEVHKDTQTIPLVHDYDFRHIQPTRHPALKVFERSIRPILAMTADFYDTSPQGRELTEKHGLGYFVRANLVRLSAGGTIVEHRDMNFSLAHSHRVHVPIVTNDKVIFSIGSESLNIPEGEIYEINNRRLHSVRNEGDDPRVHLILDYVLKGEQCCCGKLRHPDSPCTAEACEETDRCRIPCNCFPESR